MSIWQREYVTKQETQTSDSQTWKKDLPRTGVLSVLDIVFRATNGATSNKDNHPHDLISKIEVIADGSKVIKSLSAKEIVELNHFDYGVRGGEQVSENADDLQYNTMKLHFGRFPGDKTFGLDLAKFTNVELKVTYNLATTTAVGATGFVSGTTRLDVMALRALKNQQPGVRGYLKTSQIESFTSAASGDKVIELPLKHDYRRIMVDCFETAIADGADITDIKFELDNGDKTPFAGSWLDIQRQNHADLKIDSTYQGILFKSDTDTFETHAGTIENVNIAALEDVSATNDTFQTWNVDTVAGGVATINAAQADVTAGSETFTDYTTDTPVFYIAKGIGVGNAIMIPMNYGDDPMDYIKSGALGAADLTLTQAAAGGATNVVLDELVYY